MIVKCINLSSKLFLIWIISYSSLSAAQRNFIKKINYTPGRNISRLSIYYNGEADFKLRYLKSAKQYVLEINGQEFEANLTKRLAIPRRFSLISEITPYNVYGKRSKSRILIQLKKSARVIKRKLKGVYHLCFTKPGRLNSFACEGSNLDRVSMRSAVEVRAVEVAQELIETLSSPVNERIYKGETISLESANISVHDIFRLVGDASGLNIISSSGVRGEVTLSVKDIPWDQLLDLVLQDKKLKITASGNVIRITTIDEYTKEQEKIRELKQAQEAVEPVFMAIIPISYAKASDIKSAIAALLKLGTATETKQGAAVASDRTNFFVKGQVEVDERTNSLLITHTMEQIARVRSLVKELDVPSPQVLVESKIVAMSDGYTRTLGINWGGGSFGRSLGLAFGFNTTGEADSGDAGATGDAEDPGGAEDPGAGEDPGTGEDPGGGDTGGETTAGADEFKVTVGGTAGGGFRVRLGTTSQVDFQLEAAELNNKGKIISSPRLLVSNKQTASITDGQKIRIRQQSEDGISESYVDAVLTLSVTPQITNSGFVVMDIDLNQDVPVGGSTDIETKALKTNVLVENGSTLVLGGVYSYNRTNEYNGVPVLMDLPFIGPLFVRKSKVVRRTELLMFVTPRISDISSSIAADEDENGENTVL